MRTYLILLALIIVPSIALGAEASDAFIPLTNLPGIEAVSTSDSLPTFFNNLYRLCIGAAAVIAILQIMRAGSKFMFNKGSVAQNTEAKHLIMNSILGLLLVLSPAIIFGVINKDILNLSLDLSGLNLGNPDVIDYANATRVKYSSCSDKYEPIFAVEEGHACDTTAGFVALPQSCHVEGEKPGTTYCGKPKASASQNNQSTQEIQSKEYEWRFWWRTGENNVSAKAPYGQVYTSQTACQTASDAEIQKVNAEHPDWNLDSICTCATARGEQPGCIQR